MSSRAGAVKVGRRANQQGNCGYRSAIPMVVSRYRSRESAARAATSSFSFAASTSRVCEILEILHGVHDRRGDDEPGEPLVVGRHDEPRRVL